MDQAVRNQLQRATQAARALLEQEFAAQLEGTYDILPNGTIAKKAGPHLDGGGRLIRGKLVETIQHRMAGGQKAAEAVGDYTREAAFTCLNRFVALKMLEARELVQTCVSKGDQSGGFREFCGLAPGLSELPDGGYQLYLECLFDELSTEVKVLFDRRDPASLLWPRRQALLGLLEILNQAELAGVWIEDETIGWVYQYFNSQEERRQMREESQAPRNSRELAVRNQFFTPRYVVQFLTDNTLGRIWYEMRQGRTSLVEKCQYLVRRPDEVFLGHMTSAEEEFPAEGSIEMAKLLQSGDESSFATFDARDPGGIQRRIDLGHCVDGYERHPAGDRPTWQWMERTQRAVEDAADLSEFSTQDLLDLLFLTCRNDRATDGNGCEQDWYIKAANEVRRRALRAKEPDLSQEELLKAAVFVPYRAPKEAQELKILDPACGSGHFLLYCFDLLQTIYEEAWNAEDPPADDEERLENDGEDEARREEMLPLRKAYPTIERLRVAVPALILRHNLHGIDIDPRCTQIAAFALWMRAQRAYSEQGLERNRRLPIRKTNIVVAEPMPGEKELLSEFAATLRPELLRQLVEIVFEKMRLAGEAGSLLRIEEELADAISTAKNMWAAEPKFRQQRLFADGDEQLKQLEFDLSGVTDEQFWVDAETKVLEAVHKYAQGTKNELEFRRRLFAEDAAHGFAFIDLCRQRYDAVLMNPPFGSSANGAKHYVDCAYEEWRYDLYPCFISRGANLLTDRGRVGYLAPRTGYFSQRLSEWRMNVLLSTSRLILLADLGHGVLDDALVEVAAGVVELRPDADRLVAFDCLRYHVPAKGNALFNGISKEDGDCEHTAPKKVHDHDEFLGVPGKKLLFGAPAGVLRTFSKGGALDPDLADVREGPHTADNERFVRLWWEVCQNDSSRASWPFYAKGGDYAPYYASPHLLLDWRQQGRDIAIGEHSVLPSKSFYLQPGLTYTERTASIFNVRLLPEGCVFSQAGPIICPKCANDIFPLLGIMMSLPLRATLEMLVGTGDSAVSGSAARHFLAGIVGSVHIPSVEQSTWTRIGDLARECAASIRLLRSDDETDIDFTGIPVCDASIQVMVDSALRRKLCLAQASYRASWEIEQICNELYSLGTQDLEVCDHIAGRHPCSQPLRAVQTQDLIPFEADSEDALVDRVSGTIAGRAVTKPSHYVDRRVELACTYYQTHPDSIIASWPAPSSDRLRDFAIKIVSGAVGAAFGRWKVWCSLDLQPDNEDAIGELTASPICIVLVNTKKDGFVLVDEEGHEQDALVQVQRVMREVWAERGDEIFRETASLLGVSDNDLRSWFRKCFFEDHIKRYSKSRRKAPIYWQLATPTASYSVWLYYHRLIHDTFFRILSKDLLGGKLEHEERRLARMRADVGVNPTRTQSKGLETQEAFVAELTTFRDEIERIAPLWNPNLNDGVIINFAPLWRLVPQHRAWQKECKECWGSLVAGEYDWAHLAMHLWPERVVPKCRDDRSLAIAHGLEDLLWVEDYGKWRVLSEPEDEIEDQKKRQRLDKHDRLRAELASLALCAGEKLTAAELWKKLEAGDLDDTGAALLLWPRRVVEKCMFDLTLADKLHVAVPKRRTDKAVERLIKRHENGGCGHLVESVEAVFSERNDRSAKVWQWLENGELDGYEVALALWPDRVVEKCTQNRDLAVKHDLARFLWYDDPWPVTRDPLSERATDHGPQAAGWRRRQSPEAEMAGEIAHRHKPAVKAALESLLSAPTPGNGKKGRRKRKS